MKNYEWYGDKYIKSVNDAKRMGLTGAAMVVQGAAIALSPVKTGNLRGSISFKVESEDEARVGTNVEYAPYVEYGTVKMAAQPYLRPALDKNRAAIQKMVADAISKAVK